MSLYCLKPPVLPFVVVDVVLTRLNLNSLALCPQLGPSLVSSASIPLIPPTHLTLCSHQIDCLTPPKTCVKPFIALHLHLFHLLKASSVFDLPDKLLFSSQDPNHMLPLVTSSWIPPGWKRHSHIFPVACVHARLWSLPYWVVIICLYVCLFY